MDPYRAGAHGFGFVVARFGLFIQQLQFAQHATPVPTYGLSLWFGMALIVAGVAVFVLSAWHHVELVRELNEGRLAPPRPSTSAVVIALFLALAGIAMTIYLLSVRASENSNSSNQKIAMTSSGNNGIIRQASNHSVDETVERLKKILQAKGVALFALVDHSGEAEKVGMRMPATKLLIFGSPKAGTPLMLTAPSVAIDLPLKILVAEDEKGKVWISYNSSAYLQERHKLPPELLQNIAVVQNLAEKAAE